VPKGSHCRHQSQHVIRGNPVLENGRYTRRRVALRLFPQDSNGIGNSVPRSGWVSIQGVSSWVGVQFESLATQGKLALNQRFASLYIRSCKNARQKQNMETFGAAVDGEYLITVS
jgi:hypothetical protein